MVRRSSRWVPFFITALLGAKLYPVPVAEIKAGLPASASGRLPGNVIESTFVLLKGIGDQTERRWWDAGIVDWAAFLRWSRVPGLSVARKHSYEPDLARAQTALATRNSVYFATCLRPRDHWRLFPLFRRRAVYLDIETTGGEPGPASITVVGIHANDTPLQLVSGLNLSRRRLNDVLDEAPFLVTFFGTVFDVPYLKRVFPGLRTPPLHYDLCFAARRLGLTGGLKAIERQLGITRDSDLNGLDGWDAVRLWQRWRTGDACALDLLLRYNSADTEHLVSLAEYLYEGLVRAYGLEHLERHLLERGTAR